MSAVVPSMVETPATPDKALARVAKSRVGSVNLLANASMASRLDVEDSLGWHMVFPVYGSAEMEADGDSVQFHAGSHALLLPNFKRTTRTTKRSVVFASLCKSAISQAMRSVSGRKDDDAEIEERLHLLELSAETQLFRSFVHICRMINNSGDPYLEQIFRLDEALYRWIAIAMLRCQSKDVLVDRLAIRSNRISGLCDVIMAQVGRPMTLTEMEATSGLSSRTLQYAFNAEYGCSPMEWQRRERLKKAREMLLGVQSDLSITQLAIDLGFSSSAAFSTLYKRMFGETPSQTIARH